MAFPVFHLRETVFLNGEYYNCILLSRSTRPPNPNLNLTPKIQCLSFLFFFLAFEILSCSLPWARRRNRRPTPIRCRQVCSMCNWKLLRFVVDFSGCNWCCFAIRCVRVRSSICFIAECISKC